MRLRLCEALGLTLVECWGHHGLLWCIYHGFGVVFMHQDWVIVYALRKLKPHEGNYLTHDLELMKWSLLSRFEDTICMKSGVPSTLTSRVQILEETVYMVGRSKRLRQGDSLSTEQDQHDNQCIYLEYDQCTSSWFVFEDDDGYSIIGGD